MNTTQAREPAALLAELNRAYETVHTAKEDAFWSAYMGLADDADAARRALDEREIAWSSFLRDPAALARVRTARASASAGATEDERVSLAGWQKTFEAHVVDSAAARALADEIVAAEGALARRRAELELSFEDASGARVRASSVELGVRVASDPSERVRRTAWEALRKIEEHVLANGFLELVRLRNRLGRMLGGADYYDWKVRRVEGLSKAEVFAWLGELEERTRTAARASIESLRAKHGALLQPWSVRFLTSGDISNAQEPYFPFAHALERWGRSFSALGIRYRGAELVLDLVDRRGKYENGFMHGPVPAWRDHGAWRPARIQFTANAIPGLTGAGRRATDTLFHEGGHAAHFANIDMPAPCFAQEYAPSSVAFAETQSMFLESFTGDADWQTRYARDAAGAPVPLELIEASVRANQPMAAWSLRAMFAIPFAEKAIYEIPDEELSAERVLAELRRVERELLFLDAGGARPALSVPHLLAGESSAYYHGYVLAQMAVDQTRAFFLARDGALTDNAAIGPDLARTYWAPGNALGFAALVERLTGAPLSARAIAERVTRSPEEAFAVALASARRAAAQPLVRGAIELDARVRVVHGRETIADSAAGGFERACETFASWIGRLERERDARG
jgi:Zn-dependent oligopeptidase